MAQNSHTAIQARAEVAACLQIVENRMAAASQKPMYMTQKHR